MSIDPEAAATDGQDAEKVPSQDRPMTAPSGPAEIRPEDEDGDAVPDSGSDD